MEPFQFRDFNVLTDGEIDLVTEARVPIPETPVSGNWEAQRVPAYEFGIFLHGKQTRLGGISLRAGDTPLVVLYAGHIGYGIDVEHRGHHYAAKACRIVKQVALDHGFKELWITTNPDNWPSRRTCEILGCEMVEIVDLPEDTDMYREGERQKCRYRWDLTK
jgi:tagatose 1,6-diphosphate aldolase